MRDPAPALQKAYLSVLRNLTVADSPVKAYLGQVPNNPSDQYVLLTRLDALDASQKNGLNVKLELQLYCVAKQQAGTVLYNSVDGLVDAVLNLLFPDGSASPLLVEGWSLWLVKTAGIIPLPDQATTGGTLTRRLIRIRHELNPI